MSPHPKKCARSEGLLTDAMLPGAIDLAEARLFISLYQRPADGEYLLVVSNLAKESRDITINLAPSKFDLGGVTATDLLRDEPATLDGHTIQTSVGPEDFRLIAIR